ncbi:MAG TPA: hypothetical protein VFB45_22675 [Pseudolabrys sp.]|nr:hypothetical protein [Pseudolabrys sp.]
MRRLSYVAAAVVGVVVIGLGGLWWRLSSGPIELDIATPWLTAAIEQNFGSSHKVEVGGTQLERTEGGHTALRIRDIVVRDADGTVVASAPKAEIGLSGSSLLSGRIRAQSLNLVGAELAVRIEADGKITVFAGADKRPIATTAIVRPPLPPPDAASAVSGAVPPAAARGAFAEFAAMLLWIDGLGASGLDGYDLGEIGLKSGNLRVDDQRNGKRWSFTNIDLSLTRQKGGAIVFRLGSEDQQRPWQLVASVAPKNGGLRDIALEADKVSTKDLLLALRLGEGEFEADLPISASVRGEVAADGTPLTMVGRILAEAGYIADMGRKPQRINLDRVEIAFDWDIRRGTVQIPHLHIVSGSDRATLMAQLEAPQAPATAWTLGLGGGTIVLTGAADENPLVINRIAVRARLDPGNRRIDLDQADFSSIDLGLAVSGHLDASGTEPRLTLGVAATKMSVTALKRMWPKFIASGVHDWVLGHVSSGNVERLVIAANAPLPAFKEDGPPMPEEGLSVEIETSGTTLRPVDNLPPIRDADLNVRITGGTANIALGRGTLDVSATRKLNIAGGLFEIADTHQKPPLARTRFRLDGSLAAAAELLATDKLREDAGFPLDPSSSRGTVTAQVTVSLPIMPKPPKSAVTYAIAGDITNFVADKVMLGQRVEATVLHAVGNPQGYQIKGDVKIGGTPANLEFRKVSGEPDAEVRLQTTLDDAARGRLGIDFGSTVAGSVPVKLVGRVGGNDPETRFNAELDLGPAKIDNLLPGWVKPAGRAARATFTMVKDKTTRFDDLSIDGPGTVARGSVELDANGDLMSANFPVFAMSDGDKLTLKADRGTDNVIRVVMRGDVYDGHNFIKSSMSGPQNDVRGKRKVPDVDLDVKLGLVAGFHGEALRALDLKLSRRAGRIRSFGLSARIGRDAPLVGDLRVRSLNNRQVIYLETTDAGALFRLADVYPRLTGGKMWVAMDPPNAEGTPQDGVLNISDFSIRGEQGLDPVLANAPNNMRNASNVDFTQLHVDFTRTPGRTTLRDGVVRGPVIGATIDGNIDYTRDEVLLRGTFVPLYGLNNMFGQLPILGMFLGNGPNEGVFGITYEVTGPPGNTRIKVNPLSAVAPGLLRKLFEFRDTNGSFAEPTR